MGIRLRRVYPYLFSCLLLAAPGFSARAASYLPLSDSDLARRAPVIVHAEVVSQETRTDTLEGEIIAWTRTTLRPIEVLKGELPDEDFQLELPGGEIDGVRTEFPGTPDFSSSREVILFLAAGAKSSPILRLTELGLSKFDIVEDAAGRRFAVRPAFSAEEDDFLSRRPRPLSVSAGNTVDGLRDADSFLSSLRALARGEESAPVQYEEPQGEIRSTDSSPRALWVNIGGTDNGSNRLFRWFWETGASPAGVVSVNGTQSNLSDGSDGIAHVQNATNSWLAVPSSDIRYRFAASGGNIVVNLDVESQGSAWSGPLPCNQGGVVGYGGPGPSSSAPDFKGDGPYYAIRSGTVWIRRLTGAAGCYSAATFEAAVLHEMGHTLGLGHPDQNTSIHSAMCPFASCSAVMRSTLTGALVPQPDDVAGIQWYYGTDSAARPPTADFRAPLSVGVNTSVQFTDHSTGSPTSWFWTFGDGQTSTTQNPIHLYAMAGVFTVSLTASNLSGPSTASRTITVTSCASGTALCRSPALATECCRAPRSVPFRAPR